ncbi:unnamed protein product [Pocillopora meandrina]|uniref:Uncharacterized protein n=1 Tax=Pocillopora meandrina TaxID=46732 RepID=A0AAU9WZV7_9CNID|nr:unnamed protein product [Pocillopora meandrina]
MTEEKRVEKNFSIFEYIKSTCVKTWFDRAKMLTVFLRNPHYVISFKNFQDQLGRRSLLLQAFPTLWQDIMGCVPQRYSSPIPMCGLGFKS